MKISHKTFVRLSIGNIWKIKKYNCVAQSQHYAGVSFDAGQTLTNSERNYQRNRVLGVDGIVGCTTWRSLQEDVVGTGRTSTTIDYFITII